MGASPLQIIRYFLIPEALGSLVLAITTAIIGLIGSTAMAGAVGGGGIGDLALCMVIKDLIRRSLLLLLLY